MSREMLALLLSAFACPGVGQVMLGRRRGWAFIITSVVIAAGLMVCITLIFVEEVPIETFYTVNSIELMKIYIGVREQAYAEGLPILLAFLLVWIVNIVDIVAIKIKEKS